MKSLFLLIIPFLLPLMGNDSKPLKLVGATTLQPIIEMVRNDYHAKTQIDLFTEGGGSDKGIHYLAHHKTDIAMINRYPSEEEKKRYAHAVIGHDAVAIIVHKHNPVTSISKQQLIDIYRGNITTWDQLGGKKRSIIAISKKKDRGTLYLFENATGLFHPSRTGNSDPSKKIASAVWEAGANNDNIVWVGGLPDAISYISYGNAKSAIAKGMPIKIIPLDGYYPSEETISGHTYPIIGELTLLYDKHNTEAQKFMAYMLSDEGQKAVEKNQFSRVNP